MKLVWAPRPVFLLLFLAVLLVLTSLFQSISKQRNLQFTSNPLFVFSLFNIIIFAIIVGDHRPSTEEVGSILPFLYGEDATDDIEDDDSEKHCNMDGYGYVNGSKEVNDQDDDSEEDEEDYDSDGYYEDDDDNSSNDEIGWGDTDESDDNLERRVEDYDSDGYYEDDDDNSSNDEIGWGDTDESDDNLERRVEDFIDRVYKGWREERLRDSLCNPLQFFGYIKPL